MPEFIEREAVIKKLNNIATDYIKDNSIQCSIAAGTVVDIRDSVIIKAPAADVVEVVRCKECKHFSKVKQLRVTDLNFSYCHKFHHNITKDDDFCSYGERREF